MTLNGIKALPVTKYSRMSEEVYLADELNGQINSTFDCQLHKLTAQVTTFLKTDSIHVSEKREILSSFVARL